MFVYVPSNRDTELDASTLCGVFLRETIGYSGLTSSGKKTGLNQLPEHGPEPMTSGTRMPLSATESFMSNQQEVLGRGKGSPEESGNT
jgi:hypothetical protein